MAQEEYRPPVKEVLDMLADLLAEKYFERMEAAVKGDSYKRWLEEVAG